MRGIDGKEIFVGSGRSFERLSKKGEGEVRLAGRIKDAPAFKQISHLRTVVVVRQHRFDLIERGVGFVKLALQAL
jgi:hypothetical protein